LRDLGKVSISEKILTKTDKLTNKEISLLKEHPIISADIIRPVHALYHVLPLVLYHHENWDGTGYPLGMKGDEIPRGAQIVSIADMFQALISDRPYHRAYKIDEAIKIINESAGARFDPYLVENFVSII
jgi:HD-GYP domain-containing protein (c-di-GMP phosphodiesterase class II)